ncbi:MAG TPA: glycosyl hydrolase [Thermoguttaceae bacterium]|nr:glycosyl hydrolase [Thermoguttaceae bacterium]
MKPRLTLHLFVLFSLAMVFAHFAPAYGGDDGDWADIERQFRELPIEARRLTGPLFWLHGDESQERLEGYLEKVAEGGNGCFTAESRPHNDWLGPGWYRDLKICLDAAKKQDLKMWIFDERWWPSQMVGGDVPPQYGSKFLEADRTVIEGPMNFEAEGYGGPHFVAAVAGREAEDGKIDSATLLDLNAHIQAGRLQWRAPDGRWSVVKLTWQYAGAKGHQKPWVSVDGASRDSVQWFLQHVYQPHYDRFKDDFGKTIVGYFYDEPETQGDWGTELIPELERRRVDWKTAVVAWKYDLSNAEEQTAARYQYRDAFAEAWGRTMYGGMTDWCHAHGVQSIGHFMEHGRLYLHPTYCAGNLFQLLKYSDMGAIDLVCRQMYPGQRPHDIYQTPKLASSISHVYGKENDLAMCEIFGGYGQNLTYPEMKWLTDQHQVRGVNFMIPHSFNPRAPYDRDFPPYFFNNGFEPRWPLYRVYADYTSRLSAMLTGGHHVCPVALLYLGNSYHVGKSVTPENMTTALQDALFDCDWMPYDVFEREVEVSGAALHLRKEQYRVLIVPAVEVIPYETLAKAKAFFDAGGVVLGYGILPSKSASPGKDGRDIAALRDAIWGESPEPGVEVCRTSAGGGRAYFLPETPTPEQVRRVLAGDSGIHPTLEVLQGETNHWLHVLHRVKAGRNVFFITNQHHDGPTKRFRMLARVGGVPEVWDAMRGTIASLAYAPVGDNLVELELTLEPLESVLLVFQPEARTLPGRIEPETEPSREPIEVKRLPTTLAFDDTAWPAAGEIARFGAAPWGDLSSSGTRLTTSPVKVDPFVGRFTLPADWLEAGLRVCLEADAIAPENAAAVKVNGQSAGGFIGKPLRLDITSHSKAGENTLEIAPFAPALVRVSAYPAGG